MSQKLITFKRAIVEGKKYGCSYVCGCVCAKLCPKKHIKAQASQKLKLSARPPLMSTFGGSYVARLWRIYSMRRHTNVWVFIQ